jgi:hypothetical protein
MLQWFRGRARGLAAAVLWSLASVGALSIAPHGIECDDASEGVFRIHDPAAHQVGTPASAERPPLHGVLCHWAQSFRAAEARDADVHLAHVASPTAPLFRVRALSILSRHQIPPRAPPA